MLRVPYELAHEVVADRDLRYVDHVLGNNDYDVRDVGGKRGMYLIDDEVHIAHRDHLPIEQVLFVADTAN